MHLKPQIVVCDFQANPFDYLAQFIGVMAAGGVHLSTRDSARSAVRLDSLGLPWNAITVAPQAQLACRSHLRLALDQDGTVVMRRNPAASRPGLSYGAPGRILETSGTTGEPKWVYWTERNLLADRRDWIEGLGLSGTDTVLNLHPLDFAHGLDVHLLSALLSGAKAIHRNIRTDAPEAILRDMARHGVTMMSALPSHYTRLAAACDDTQVGVTVRWALTGGALLSPATVEQIRGKSGLRLKRLYGATEAGIMCADLVSEDQRFPTLRPMPGVAMQIRPLQNGVTSAFPRVGEPYFRRTNVASAYWGDQERTATAFADGWYKSGDAIILNDDGSLAVLGRAEDVWIDARSGGMFSGGELCASITEIDGIDEVALIPPDSQAQSSACVFCVIAPSANVAGIRQQVALKLVQCGLQASVYLSNDWPRTVVGKPERRALLAWARA